MVLQEHTKIGELALSLGLSQAEARHENDLFGVHKLHGQIIGGSFFHGAFRTFASASGGIGTAETACEHGQQRTVHSLGHGDGQGHASGANQCAGHDQSDVVDGQARHGHCSTSAGVEHGNDHRHIGAADRDDEHEAVAQGEYGGEHGPQQTLARLHAQHDKGRNGQHGEQNVPEALARQAQLLDPLDALQFASCDQRAGKRDGTDHDT